MSIIGMGLNLNIRRIIFSSLIKQQTRSTTAQVGEMNSVGNDMERDEITTSQALQIAGRAGRYRTEFPDGLVTTLNAEDCKFLF
jgi:ATP-dependent RNA helicase SUPV3L1/SUV3